MGNAETKRWSGAVPIPLLTLSASVTSADTLQELNPRPRLRKASVYHTATSAVDSSFYWTRGSKQCFLTCFSYFSCYLYILVFLQNHYLLISLRLSWLHWNLISRPVSHIIGTLSLYIVHAPPCFWHRTLGCLKARCSWEPGSSLTTGEFSLFHLLLKVSGANVCWTDYKSYLSFSQKSSN